MTLILSIATTLAIKSCNYLYHYDSGEKETLCIVKEHGQNYMSYGDFIDDAYVKLDCTKGIVSIGEKVSETQPGIVKSVMSRCLPPNETQNKIIMDIYGKYTKIK
jgi:hypothetical protein